MVRLIPDRRGKNSKFLYYLNGVSMYLIPRLYLKRRLIAIKKQLDANPDRDYILNRVNYYCKIKEPFDLPDDAMQLQQHSVIGSRSAYFFDSFEYTRYFNQKLHWIYRFGDMKDIPSVPTIQKARVLQEHNENAILMKLDKARHFMFVNDSTPFIFKKNKVIFRGVTAEKPKREQFLIQYHHHPLCDVGDTGNNPKVPQAKKISVYDHLAYKFIMCLEGNDVATNLKWVMSSNSIAVMPPPTCETWFMEGTLIPDYHFISIKPDFSDLIEKVTFYNNHPELCEAIIKNAQNYVLQFRNKKREDIISLLVLDKYLSLVNQ